MSQGAMAGSISSDIHVFSGNSPALRISLGMSKFLSRLGFSLDRSRHGDGQFRQDHHRIQKLGMAPGGSLQVVAPGDVTIHGLVLGRCRVVDTQQPRDGKAWLQPCRP